MPNVYEVETSHQFKVRRCGPPRVPCAYEIHADGAVRYVGSTVHLPERLAAHWRRNTHNLKEFQRWRVVVYPAESRGHAGRIEERRLLDLTRSGEGVTLRNKVLSSCWTGGAMIAATQKHKDKASPDPEIYTGAALLVLEPGQDVPSGWEVISSTMLGDRRVARRVD